MKGSTLAPFHRENERVPAALAQFGCCRDSLAIHARNRRALTALAPDPPPLSMLARGIPTQRARSIVVALIQQHMAVWAEVVIASDTWSANVEKTHGTSFRALERTGQERRRASLASAQRHNMRTCRMMSDRSAPTDSVEQR